LDYPYQKGKKKINRETNLIIILVSVLLQKALAIIWLLEIHHSLQTLPFISPLQISHGDAPVVSFKPKPHKVILI
jgi:hypothetical protein